MTIQAQQSITFNSPLESGIRTLCLLTHAYPDSYDLHKLTSFDYLVVHTGDIEGPESLHPPLPKRPGELLVRRKLVEQGILLLLSRGLIERITYEDGFSYLAGELAETFIESLISPYIAKLNNRSNWVVKNFGKTNSTDLKKIINQFFGDWIEEFHNDRKGLGAKS